MKIYNNKINEEFVDKLKLEFEKLIGNSFRISSDNSKILKEVIIFKRNTVNFYFGFETKPRFIHKILLDDILPLNPEIRELIKKVQFPNG